MSVQVRGQEKVEMGPHRPVRPGYHPGKSRESGGPPQTRSCGRSKEETPAEEGPF